MPVNIQTLQGLFGQASPYGAFLHGQALAAQEKEKQLQAQKTLADIAATQASTAGIEEDTRLKRAIFGDKVQAAGLENIEKEEAIVGQRKENWAKDFDNQMKNVLGVDHYAENERTKAASAKIDQMQKIYDGLGPLAIELENTPMLQRTNLLIQHGRRIGMTDAQIGALLEVPVEHMPQALQQLARRAAQRAPEFMRQTALEELKHKQAMDLAKMKAKLDKELADLKAAGEDKMKTLESAIVAFTNTASKLPDDHPDKAYYAGMGDYYVSIFLAEKEAKAQPTVIESKDKAGRPTPKFIGPTAPSEMIGELPTRGPQAPNPSTAQSIPKTELDQVMDKYRKK